MSVFVKIRHFETPRTGPSDPFAVFLSLSPSLYLSLYLCNSLPSNQAADCNEKVGVAKGNIKDMHAATARSQADLANAMVKKLSEVSPLVGVLDRLVEQQKADSALNAAESAQNHEIRTKQLENEGVELQIKLLKAQAKALKAKTKADKGRP